MIVWDPDDDPRGNVQHLARHDVSKADVAEVLRDPIGQETSQSTGRPIVFGETRLGRRLAVVFEVIDAGTVYPITAFDVDF